MDSFQRAQPFKVGLNSEDDCSFLQADTSRGYHVRVLNGYDSLVYVTGAFFRELRLSNKLVEVH